MRVDFLQNGADFAVLVLGNLGFSTDYISHHTKLTPCQVMYRLGKQHVRRSDYRNGDSPAAAIVLSQAERAVAKSVREKLFNKGRKRRAG